MAARARPVPLNWVNKSSRGDSELQFAVFGGGTASRTLARSPERGIARCVEGGCETKMDRCGGACLLSSRHGQWYYCNLSDIARDTASVRVLTAGSEKIRLT